MKFVNLWFYFSTILLNCNMCTCLCRTSSYAQSFYSENQSGHKITCGIVVMKIAHWSIFGFRLEYLWIQTFDVKRTHNTTGHRGRDRMIKETQRKYANISTNTLELFKLLYQECQKKRKRPITKGVVIRPNPGKEFASRGQADFVDMQPMPRNSYKWIMVSCWYKVLWTVSQSSVFCDQPKANVLQKLQHSSWIFLPFLLRQYFRATMVLSLQPTSSRKLKRFGLPALVMVHGKARHPQSQGSVERANGDLKGMLVARFANNDTHNRVTGIKCVQFQKNSAHHSGIKCSPCSALFGKEVRVGLTMSSLP